MAAKQPKKKTNKVFRSIEEFEAHFFPKAHADQLSRQNMQDPESFGTGLAEEFLEGVRQALRRR